MRKVLFIICFAFTLLTGKLLFSMLNDCHNIFDYIIYGIISTIWIGMLALIWILLINYINEERDI